MRAATVCGAPYCPHPATVNGWCDKHRRRAGAAWQRLRAVVLERDQHRCLVCGAPATTVHHLDELVRGGRELAGLDRLESRCAAHNTRAAGGVSNLGEVESRELPASREIDSAHPREAARIRP